MTGTATDPLDACVEISRQLGADPDLVLHGGGNSSLKGVLADVTGRPIAVLWIKGSGADMAAVDRSGFTALRRDRLDDLLGLESLSDTTMMRELAAARIDPGGPSASVETLLHAILPHRVVLHSHADSVITLTNLADPAALAREVFGESTMIVPYVMPGFRLARSVADLWPAAPVNVIGIILLNHGLVTFGATAHEAYERHLLLVAQADDWLAAHAPRWVNTSEPSLPAVPAAELAGIRGQISVAVGRPMIVRRHSEPAVARFVARADLADIAGQGPLTPDHSIRTKRVPLVGTDLNGFRRDYERYFRDNRSRSSVDLTMLDPAPRIVLDPRMEMLAAGPSARDAIVAGDIYRHTMAVIERATDHLGGYRALPAADIFDLEYWELEQAKLRSNRPAPPLGGMVALVTGAASGIGRATARELLSRGACVFGLDVAPGVPDAFDDPSWLGLQVDVTDAERQRAAVVAAVEAFGGLDIVVVAAGIFGQDGPVAELDLDGWRRLFEVNVHAVADLFRLAHPILARSPVGGRVVVTASKNVHGPGPGVAAYSASKAALTQLARVVAMEWAADAIRVNVVHPDAVFDTGLWTPELLAGRAARYGLTVDAYKRRNLLGREITSASVARLIVELCTDTFEMTTGAQVPIDGGNERTI